MSASQLRAQAREAFAGKWGKGALVYLLYTVITYALSFIPLIGSIALLIISIPITLGLISTYISLKRGENIGVSDFLSIGFNNFGKAWGIWGHTLLKLLLPIILVFVFMFLGAFSSVSALIDSTRILGNIEPTAVVANSAFQSAYDNAIEGNNSYSSSNPFASAYNNSIQDESYITSVPKTNVVPAILSIISFLGIIVSSIYLTIKSYLYILPYFLLQDNPDMSSKELVEKSAELMYGNRLRYFFLTLSFIGWSILACLTCGIGMFWLMPYIMVATVCFYENLANPNTTSESDSIQYTIE